VGLTAGLAKPSTLTWNGRSKKAPETPPMEVKEETTRATRKGTAGFVSTPLTGKNMVVGLLRLK